MQFSTSPFVAPGGLIHTTAALSTASYSPVATTVNEFALFAPAGVVGSGGSGGIDIYDGATGVWSVGFPRGLNGRVIKAAATVGDIAIFVSRDTAFLYYARTGHWKTEDIPLLDVDVEASGENVVGVAVGNVAIFASGNPGAGASDTVDLYNASTGVWSSAKLSQARAYFSATVVGTTALFAGGFYSDSSSQTFASNVVDIYDSATSEWSTAALSQASGSAVTPIAAVTVGNFAIFAGGNTLAGFSNVVDVYDDSTGQWFTATLTEASSSVVAAAVGRDALFALGNGVLDIFDATTGEWSSTTLPEALIYPTATVVGSDALFGGGEVQESDPSGTAPSDSVDVYDAQSADASALALGVTRDTTAAVTVGATALFAGGNTASDVGSAPSASVDLFTLPSLSGSAAVPRRSRMSVVLSNMGASALPAPASVAVYACADGALDSDSVLLGSVRVRHPLAAGVSEPVSVPITIPATLSAGSYHLIAAAGPPDQLVEFAAQRRLLVVTQPAAAEPHAEIVRAAAPIFSSGLAIASSVLTDAEDLLA